MARPSWWERIRGSRDRLGWWMLPVFVAVGLTGAVLAGTLASVWYGQQVDELERETRTSRQRLGDAVEQVETVREEALAEIDQRVRAVRQELSTRLPVGDATAFGVVAVRATIGAGRVGPGAQATPGPTPPAARQPSPPGPGAQPHEEVGSAFTVAVEDGTAFFATSHDLLADPTVRGGVTDEVEVVTPSGASPAAVHSWDEQRGLAVIRADVGDRPVPVWRPRGERLAAGERIVTVGVTPALNTVQMGGTVAHADPEVIATDLTALGYLRGAPVVDARGLVVGVFSPGYQPFGPRAGERQGVAPAHLLCERMLQGCDQLEGERPTTIPTPVPTGAG